MRPSIPIGLLFSRDGTSGLLGREAVLGAEAALAEINGDDGFPFIFELVVRDPKGDMAAYAAHSEELFGAAGCAHVLGAITSSSRKEVIPVAERHRGLLWYAFPYEGYEGSDHVIYLGATANQQVLPLLAEAVRRYGRAPVLVAPDYVWGWEVNRIAREQIEAAGGHILDEVTLPLDRLDMDAVMARIARARPSFVLSSLIGPSSHAFVKAFARLRQDQPAFADGSRPVISCNLTEADAVTIGPAVAGTLVASSYFGSVARAEGRARREVFSSSSAAFAHAGLRLMAESIRLAGTPDPATVKAALCSRSWETVIGTLAVDPVTAHAVHAPILGRARADGSFEVVHRFPAIAPDPYLLHPRPSPFSGLGRTGLRRAH